MTTQVPTHSAVRAQRPPALWPADAHGVARRYVLAGAGWSVVAALLALAVLAPLALGRGAPFAAFGPGRLDMAYHWVAQWGMVALPLAGALYWLAGGAGPSTPGLRAAGGAFWVWQAGLVLGALSTLAGWLAPDTWAAAPLAVQAVLAAGVGGWALAVWQAATAMPERMTFARVAALTATTALLAFTLLRLMGTAIAGSGQAVTLAIATEGLSRNWVALAGVGVGAAALVSGLRRPLFGRRAALAGLALWLPLAVLAAGYEALPDLLPALLTRLVLAAEAAMIVPGTLLAVAVLGTWIGGPRVTTPPAAAFGTCAVLGIAAATVTSSAGVLLGVGGLAFTAWPPARGLVPPMVIGVLGAGAATYLVLPTVAGAAGPRRHLLLALTGALLTLAALWMVGVAGAASGPSAALLLVEARLRLVGAVVTLAAAVAWLVSAGRALPHGAPLRVAGDLALRPGTVLGATVIGLVASLFVVLFIPLADPAAVAYSPRTEARALGTAPLRAAGRDRYVAEACVACHSQRVRSVAADSSYGPASVRGDYADGPALAGTRRAGPDLMWVGDRFASREAMLVALADHAAVGPLALPWLLAPDGPTDAGLALLDYLVGLRSRGEASP